MATVSEEPESRWLRVGDVAGVLGVSANTVRRWTDAGRIAAYRSPGGHRRYLTADILALLPETAREGAAQPGDFATLRRQTQDLRAVLKAGLELMSVVAEDPAAVPGEAARTLCELTGAPRCDVYVTDGGHLRLAASMDGGDLDPNRQGPEWATAEWVPVEGDPGTAGVICMQATDKDLGRRARQALQRRGCRSLAWAPMLRRGELVGAVELSDAGGQDFSRHADALDGVARICAQAVAVETTYGELASRDKTVRELVDLSREVAQTHDFERFTNRFAQRLLTAENAARVDVYRVSGGVIRFLVSCTREGVDPSLRDTILDTARYPSLEFPLLDHSPLVINDLGDARLGANEVELIREWGYASCVTMPLVAGGELVGLVDLYDDAERDWDAELEFLTSVCQLLAGVFDSKALLDEAKQGARLRDELIALGADLAGAEAPPAIAERAAERLRHAVDCADCDIWWLEEGYLRCLASVDGDGIDEDVRGKILELDNYPSTSQALEDREILVVTSLDDPRLTDYEREDFGEFDFNSMISIPLVSNDLVVGLIDLFDVRERDYGDVRRFLPGAGRTIADALRNADLLAGLRRGNTALRELVELGDRLNEAGTLQELARAVAERLRTVLAAEDCDIWQVDGGVLRCLASFDSRGWDADEVGSERELALYETTVAALAADEPMVVGDLARADLSEHEIQVYRRWGYRSMVSLPLVVEGRAIGLIDIFDTQVRDYTVHLDLIRNVGRLLAGSFEKAMLVERLEGGNRDLRLLVTSGMEFGATLDVDAVLRTVAERILDVSQADLCDVYRLDGDEVEILLAIGEDWDEGSRGPAVPTRGVQYPPRRARSAAARHQHGHPDQPGHDEEGDRGRGAVGLPFEPRRAAHRPRRSHRLHLTHEPGGPGLLTRADGRRPRAGGEPGDRQCRPLPRARRQPAAHGPGQRVGARAHRAASISRRRCSPTARRLCAGVGVSECEITVIEGDQLTTLMRVSGDEVDESRIGQRLALADAAVTREVIETKRTTVVGSLRDPRLTPIVLALEQGTGMQELGDAAAHRQGSCHRRRRADRERRGADLHPGRARHGRRHLSRGCPRASTMRASSSASSRRRARPSCSTTSPRERPPASTSTRSWGRPSVSSDSSWRSTATACCCWTATPIDHVVVLAASGRHAARRRAGRPGPGRRRAPGRGGSERAAPARRRAAAHGLPGDRRGRLHDR